MERGVLTNTIASNNKRKFVAAPRSGSIIEVFIIIAVAVSIFVTIGSVLLSNKSIEYDIEGYRKKWET